MAKENHKVEIGFNDLKKQMESLTPSQEPIRMMNMPDSSHRIQLKKGHGRSKSHFRLGGFEAEQDIEETFFKGKLFFFFNYKLLLGK